MGETSIRLRDATTADARLLWLWRNHPSTRRWSFNKAEIAWEEHCQWLAARLSDERCLMYIAEVADHGVVGQARFSVSGEEAEIHVTVAPEHRGRGMGTAVISASCRRLFSEQPGVRRILARALPGNVASIRAFQKAGFTPVGGRRSDTPEAICLVLPRGGGSQTGE